MKHNHDQGSIASIAPRFFAHSSEVGVNIGDLTDCIPHGGDPRGSVGVATKVKVAEVTNVTQNVLNVLFTNFILFHFKKLCLFTFMVNLSLVILK